MNSTASAPARLNVPPHVKHERLIAWVAEMAALTVSPQSQGQGDGDKTLRRVEQRARAMGLASIFVLTTRTMHWFLKRGFSPVDPDWLPEARKKKYNWDRKSQVLVKQL